MSAAEIFELVIELQKSARVSMIAARLIEPVAKANETEDQLLVRLVFKERCQRELWKDLEGA